MIVKFIRQNRFLLIILLIASILRVWNLSNIPPHIRNDEAALGYNAYSILKTSKDEHGELLPIIFKSFGDWKMGGYIYITIPFVALFGLNEFSVRLPSAISGIIAIWLIFKIVLFMFSDKKLALISAFIFAISPIYIIFSRGAWEVNLSLTLTLFAIFFFLKSLNQNKFLLLSSIFFGLTFITSHTAKLSSPLMVAILVAAYYKKFKKVHIKVIMLSALITLLFIFPVALSFFEGKITRIATLSIFSYYPESLSLFQSIATRYFSIYSPSTIFIKGDTNPDHSAPGIGPLLLLDVFFLIAGIITLITRGKFGQKIFIFCSLLLLSLPSALTIEKANFERIPPMFISLLILTSLGIKVLWERVQKIKGKAGFIIFTFLFLYLLNYIYFLDQYFVHGPKKQTGFREIVEKISPIQKDYRKIVVQRSLEHPYIFFLFYQKYDPAIYHKIEKGIIEGIVTKIDNIEFDDVDWSQIKPEKNSLYIMPAYKLDEQSKFYSNYQLVDEIKDSYGFPMFTIVKI